MGKKTDRYMDTFSAQLSSCTSAVNEFKRKVDAYVGLLAESGRHLNASHVRMGELRSANPGVGSSQWYAILDGDTEYSDAYGAYEDAKLIVDRKCRELTTLRKTAIDSFDAAHTTLGEFSAFIKKKKKNPFKKKKSMPAAKDFIKNAEAIIDPLWGEVGSLPTP